jgi:5-methyltetrahydropteroyltriglutamate--homocysteine methyltransferase
MPVRHTRTSARRNHVRPDRRAGAGDLAVLRDFRADMEIGLGCVSTEPGRVDPVGEIVGRVEAVLEHLDAGRITLNPDCGFAPGSGAAVSLDEVDQKLKNEAARVLRDKYT